MVFIDTVYQKVLAIANKEQRGYITPQEFNLFADQVQRDIFEQYFYDINQFNRVPGNDTEYSDMLRLLDEKLSIFKRVALLSYNPSGYYEKPPNTYLINSITFKDRVISELSNQERIQAEKSLILKPTRQDPVYVQRDNKLYIYPINITSLVDVRANYVVKPTIPKWNYVVASGEALYNSTGSINFQLHPSEENNLINKILQLAGVTMGNEIYQIGSQEEAKDIQQEKS